MQIMWMIEGWRGTVQRRQSRGVIVRRMLADPKLDAVTRAKLEHHFANNIEECGGWL